MAIVTSSLLASLRVGFSKIFEDAKSKAPSLWQLAATLVPSTAKSTTYGWLGQYPKLREWVGVRVVQSMQEHGYSIVNKLYEATVGVARTDVEDDNLGIYTPLLAEMGYAAATHPDELAFSLLGKGTSTLCFDGQYFFDTDHPVYPNVDGTGAVATVSNLIDPAAGEPGTPWYLLDVSRPLKPLIFQERTKPELQSMTDPKQDHVFTLDEYLFGTRYRCNAGFGFWQQAICCRDTLNAANFGKALTRMQDYKADGGRPLGLGRGGKAGTLLVVPASLNSAALDVVNVQLINGGESNKWFDAATVVNCPWL
ncbi:Mu-like prophage major head subunit gpT family protein [uncultured Desulfovibrio sp.]|uniref:Mu-like prophage major head subunit gpT family protein n=1 Tax=uncultured Desulfovibrio sp. TaxID=167968 RepID=UPI00262DD8B0|nr:Mu-like prophage major head subunit gpT family protein [uncultured Desulfovibrio sp.]